MMEHRINNMKILVEDNYDAMSKKAADLIGSYVNNSKELVLGLATGSTPIGTYKELVKAHETCGLDFSAVTTFNLDEYYPIKKSNDQSYDYFMEEHLFSKINIPCKNINIPNGEAKDYLKECADYEAKIAAKGGLFVQLLGIGNNGHIGFNEPADEFVGPTHYVELDESTIKANARFFASEEEVPKHALTMGIKTIMSAKKIILVASGSGKAYIIYQTVFGPITPKNPASVLQLHQDVTIILDKEAGRLLLEKM